MSNEMRAALAAAVDEVLNSGRVVPLADKLGITRKAVYKWPRVPAHHVLDVEALTNIPRERLRPDLYGPPKERQKLSQQRPRLTSRVEKIARRAVL